jgi:hypothetical protein
MLVSFNEIVLKQFSQVCSIIRFTVSDGTMLPGESYGIVGIAFQFLFLQHPRMFRR